MTAPEIVAVLKAQHNAIDTLMAALMFHDKEFRPSKSGPIWDAVVAGNEMIKKLETP
jgi:hypothetical protein